MKHKTLEFNKVVSPMKLKELVRSIEAIEKIELQPTDLVSPRVIR
jgi:hypothetical protein